MDELLKTITIAIVTNGTVLGLFIWVFKMLFEKSLTLRAKAFQAEIELINKKNFHQYSKIFDEQAKTIGDVYSDLVQLSDQSAYLANHFRLQEQHPELFEEYLIPKDGDPLKWERYYKAVATEKREDIKAKELSEHASVSLNKFRTKRIYFKKEIASKIEHYIYLVLFVASNFKNISYRDTKDFKPVVADEVVKLWIETVNIAHELFPVIEETFRTHLGVENERTK